jgi:hypothetical protein
LPAPTVWNGGEGGSGRQTALHLGRQRARGGGMLIGGPPKSSARPVIQHYLAVDFVDPAISHFF